MKHKMIKFNRNVFTIYFVMACITFTLVGCKDAEEAVIITSLTSLNGTDTTEITYSIKVTETNGCAARNIYVPTKLYINDELSHEDNLYIRDLKAE